MISQLRLLLRTYWLPLVGYAVCLGFVTWFSGIAPVILDLNQGTMQRFLPFVIVLMMMALNFAFGARLLRQPRSEGASTSAGLSPLHWWLASFFVSCGTWLAFVFLLWWHEYPEDSLGQATRALFCILACSSVGYFWGRLAARWGMKWSWLAPAAMAAGWVLGQAAWEIIDSHSLSFSDLKDVPEDSFAKLETIAFFPLMLIGCTAVAGIVWIHFRKVNFVSCAILIPLMMVPIIWDSVLSDRRAKAIAQISSRSSPHAVPKEMEGAVRLSPSPTSLLNDPTIKSTNPNRRVWEFAIPWKFESDDPRISLIFGGVGRKTMGHEGIPVEMKYWSIGFLRNSEVNPAPDAPLIMRVAYSPPLPSNPTKKRPRNSKPIPPEPPPPENIQVKAYLRLFAFETLGSFNASETHSFNWQEKLKAELTPIWNKKLSNFKVPDCQKMGMKLSATTWLPIQAISWEKDPWLDKLQPHAENGCAYVEKFRGIHVAAVSISDYVERTLNFFIPKIL